jgi:hypothetical protein
MSCPKRARKKSTYVAFLLALLFGPLGFIYLSYRRALLILLLFLVGLFFFPSNALVVVGLWLILPASSVLAMSVAPRRATEP